MLAGIEIPVVAANQRLGEEDGIFNDGGDGEVVAVAGPMLREDGLIAARDAVAADVVLLQMRGGDGEHVALPHAGGEALPGVGRERAGVRPAVQVDGALTIPGEQVSVKGDDALRDRIDFAPDAEVAQAAHGVIGPVGAALVLLDHGDAIGVPAIGAETRGVVDGKLGVIGELGPGETLRSVFVIERRPFA